MKKIIILILSVVMLCFGAFACAERETADGEYTANVTLEGGSGRSRVESATVKISDGKAVATIVWSSPFYEYMLVDDKQYNPIQTEGNSTFEIPVVPYEKMKVSASTVAMSQPYLIDYTMVFDNLILKEEK